MKCNEFIMRVPVINRDKSLFVKINPKVVPIVGLFGLNTHEES